jgi:hypothetical protein
MAWLSGFSLELVSKWQRSTCLAAQHDMSINMALLARVTGDTIALATRDQRQRLNAQITSITLFMCLLRLSGRKRFAVLMICSATG